MYATCRYIYLYTNIYLHTESISSPWPAPPSSNYLYVSTTYISIPYVSILIQISACRIYRISLACTTLLQLSPQGAIKTVWMNKRDHLDVSIPLSPPLSPSLSLPLPLPPLPPSPSSCLTTPSFILLCLLSRYLCFLPICPLEKKSLQKKNRNMRVASALCREKERKKGAQEIIQRYFEGVYFTLGGKENWSNTKLLKPNYIKTRAEGKKCHAKTMMRNKACEAQV